MSSSYSVWLASPTGQRQALLTDWFSLDYARTVNHVTPLILTLPYSKAIWDLCVRDARIEIYRSIDSGLESLDTNTCWLLRRRSRSSGKTIPDTLRISAACATDILGRRIVAYDAGSSQADKTGAVDNLMKAIVRENLGSSAASDRTLSAYLSVHADTSAGPSTSKAFSRRGVLAVLQELSATAAQAGSPIWFDVTYEDGIFVFATYPTQRGVDRRGSIFSVGPDDSSLIDVTLTEEWADETTCIYAGGAGQGSARLVATASDAARIAASPFGRIEAWLDAREYSDSTGLAAEAQAALRAGRPRRVLTGTIQETPQKRYGVEWFWGDYLYAVIDGETFACRADTVRINVEAGHETISAYLRGEES